MATNIYTGFHAVEEKVRKFSQDKKSSLKLKLYYSKPGPRIKKILAAAQEVQIPCELTDDKTLDSMVAELPPEAREHRGIILFAEGEKLREKNEVQLDQWLTQCPEEATVVILDNVTDPHNIGAVLRSCDQFGAQLLIVPSHNSTAHVRENEIIARTSAGASAWVSIATVANLNRSIEQLKEAGFWIYGADAGGVSLQEIKFDKKTCIVMGSEGSGMNKLVAQNCDTIVSIPTCGKLDSLNVSVAAGVLLYERHRQQI